MFRLCFVMGCIFFIKQKTADEMRISDWSSDVCASDLLEFPPPGRIRPGGGCAAVYARSRRQPVRDCGCSSGETCPGGLKRATGRHETEIGRASCRERVCQYV